MATTADKPRRRRWLFVLLVLAALAVWSVGIEPYWIAERHLEYRLPGWERPPLRVAVASDWHFTKRPGWRVTTVSRAQRIVEDINAANPDVIVLLGDFISDRDYQPTLALTAPEEIALVLGKLRAPLGVYAVLGNHEWQVDGPAFAAALKARGIRVLENEARLLDSGVWVVGIGDRSTGHSRPAQAMSTVPPQAAALVLMHDPVSLEKLPPHRGLALAGHTHGGQVYLPWIGAPVVPKGVPRRWAYGWIGDAPMPAYVTSGIGVSILPVRFNMRPEWLLITLDASVG
ncbi:metallophosphoesterase [Ramlibacter humi]|uniref:Metallophosphoesterase n=1 Tax=Ramlibacter humi TaxID=2530451 RepID=A0A4Z0BK16_9BURK|nr:metallophosphoesterase [Ramlibacter humi]TFY98238.1 metallophosphoesterase [Ramlibacter humi]